MARLFVSVATLLLAFGASGAPIQILNSRPVPVGPPFGGEVSLQQVLDAIYGPGVLTDQDQERNGLWALPDGATELTIELRFELTGAGISLGIWSDLDGDDATPPNTFQFWTRGDPGDFVVVTWDGPGLLTGSFERHDVSTGNVIVQSFSGLDPSGFGIYIDVSDTTGPRGRFFTVDSLNPGPQALTFHPSDESLWTVAFEDSPGFVTDKDYNDYVLTFSPAVGLPEPGIALLLGGGLACLARWSRSPSRRTGLGGV